MRIGVLHPIPYTGNPPEIYNRIRAEFLRDIEILRTVPSFELAFEQASAPDASLGVPAVDAFCTRPDDPKCEWRQSLWDVRWEARWQAYRKAAHIHRAVDMYHHISRFLSQLGWPESEMAAAVRDASAGSQDQAVIKTPKDLAEALRTMPDPYLAESGTNGNIAHIDSMAQFGGDTSLQGYQDATERHASIKREICAFMEDNKLDAVIGPLRLCVFSRAAGAPLVSFIVWLLDVIPRGQSSRLPRVQL
jgi:hypothetical protein